MAPGTNPPQPPPRIPSTDEIVPIVRQHIAEHRSLVDAITTNVVPSTACFDNVIAPLVSLENSQSGKEAVIGALQYAAPDKATQNAVEEAWALWREAGAETSKRTDLFLLIKAVNDKGEPLDCESQKLVERRLRRYTESGHGLLKNADIQRLLETRKQIGALCTEYNRNIREYDKHIWFTDEELDGLPKNELDRHPLGPNGKRHLCVKGRDDVLVVMRYVHSSSTRKQVQAVDAAKLYQNVPLFKQIIRLRDQNARLLGHKSHASYRLPYRMPESTEWIDNLLSNLAESMVPDGIKELHLVEEKKTSHLAVNNDPQSVDPIQAWLEPWDHEYYRRLVEEDSAVDQDKISEYFPLRHTVGAMLELFSSYLQLRFTPIPASELEGSTWCEDVEVWSVWDERLEAEGDFVGYLYLDILERPNKYKGNQCVNLQPSYLREDGSRVYPVTTLMCSFPRPTPTGCALLKHSNVVTLFHELGHGMHDLLARTKYAQFHGYRVCLEFGEAIGTMLENWCWMKDELKAMSCHYTKVDPRYMEAWKEANPGADLPPKMIPDELLENIPAQRLMNRLRVHLTQLEVSLFDMGVHNPSSHEDLLDLDEVKLYQDLYEQFRFYRPPEPSYLHVRFGHLVSGYDAGYYSYLCANVFAEEMFQENFAKDHTSQAAWDKFRRGILEYGGSRNEREVLEEFLGRPPTTDALLRNLRQGLDASLKDFSKAS